MKLPVTAAQSAKIGTCPHGLPPGACPICSGGGAGAAGAQKKADFSAKPGEMSWAECAAIGNMLKSQKLSHQRNEQAFQAQMLIAAGFEKNIANLAQKIADFAQKIQNTPPAIISKPLGFIANKVLVPILNILKDIPLNIQNVISKISEKLTDISDKLNALFGELKNSVEKKISDKLKDFKKKFSALFSIFGVKEPDDEEQKIDEADKIFREKTVLHSLKEKSEGSGNDEN